jgi:hypothetical protein
MWVLMHPRRILFAALALLLPVIGVTFGRPWVALARAASSYPVTQSGEAANVVMVGDVAFATLGERGFEVIDGDTKTIVAPPQGSESVDDVAVADGFLFVLDARPPGHLSVFALRDLSLVSNPVDAEVGPFSGVSAAHGRVIVSGGTSRLSLRHYDAHGILGDIVATNDFGRGQPDVVLSPDGTRAFVSTHFFGPYFGMTTARVTDSSIDPIATLHLDTYGFTPGGAKPASFPLRAALDGDVLLIADADGLHVVERDREIARLDVGVKAVSIDVRDHLAAIVGSSPAPRLVLVDVRVPRSPRIVRVIPLPPASYPTGVAIGATRIAVAAHQSGVLFFQTKEQR